MADAYIREAESATPIKLVRGGDFDAWLKAQPPEDQVRVRQQRFQAKPKQVCWLGGLRGQSRVATGWDGASSIAAPMLRAPSAGLLRP